MNLDSSHCFQLFLILGEVEHRFKNDHGGGFDSGDESIHSILLQISGVLLNF